jgi:3-keto-disaccharide hydrolase
MRYVLRTMALAGLVLVVVGGPLPARDKPGREDEADFKPLFDLPKFVIYNGTTNRWAFTGDGLIVSEGSGGGWLLHPREFGDLELRLEYKMTKGGNSGVALRCPLRRPEGLRGSKAEPSKLAYEIQLVDDDNSPDGKDPLTCTGSIYGIVPAVKRNVSKPLGEWNELRVVARGTQVTATLNGETVQDVDLKKYADSVQGKNPHFLDARGHVGLQSWRGRVEFRNLRIKEP